MSVSRDAAFLPGFRDSGARFVAGDLPNADEALVSIMAVISRWLIASER
jgi:hypothetical protein